MPEVLTFCGFRCDLCPAYNKNKGILATPQEISDGWKQYLDLPLSPEQISCSGCRSIGKRLDADCPVRPCILKKKLETCADCEAYETCEHLHSRADAIEPIKKKFEGKLTEKEFALFIRPYEGRRRLEALKEKINHHENEGEELSMFSFDNYPLDWLLEEDNPSVRYYTLRDLLGKPENNQELRTAKQQIMETGIVPRILAKQNKEGYWETPDSFYTAKYKGTVWQLLILAELGADGKNESIQKAFEFILKNSQDLESGGFAHTRSAKKGGGRHSDVIPCLTGNMVFSLLRFGYFENPQVQQGIQWITSYQRFDDGRQPDLKGWPYDRLKAGCLGKHTCHMGAVKALKALAEIPEKRQSSEVKQTIENGVEYLLLHHIYKKSHDLNHVAKPGWLKLGFPLMYQNDILEILGILTTLGYSDERMQEAIDVVVSKQDKQGKWILENTFNGRYQTNIEQKGKPSKWITLNALRVLKKVL